MVTESRDHLSAELHRIGDSPAPLSDEDAERFLREFPLPVLFGQLQSQTLDPATLQAACGLLDKLFRTKPGAALLPDCVGYGAAALHSAEPSLRQLGARQLGRILVLLLEGDAGDGDFSGRAGDLVGSGAEEAVFSVLEQLVGALEDPDTGVGHAAKQAVEAGACTAHGFRLLVEGGAAGQLQQLLCSGNPPVRIRALALVTSLAGRSHESLQVLQSCGLMEPLLKELRDPQDVLSCMGALQLLDDLLHGCPEGSGPALYALLVAPLAALAAGSPGGDHMLRRQALKVAGSLLGKASDGPAGPDVLLTGGVVVLPPGEAACALLGPLLDPTSKEEVPDDLTEAALEAVVAAATFRGGACLLLTAATSGGDACDVAGHVAVLALGRTAARQLRIAALHALASLCGTEWAVQAGSGGGEQQQGLAQRQGRGAAAPPPLLLPAAAEQSLKAALYRGASCSSRMGATPVEVLWELLRQPFADTRLAVYRLLAGLCTRPWAAAELLAQQQEGVEGSGMVAHLADPGSETVKQLCEWRFAALSVVAATCQRACQGPVHGAERHHVAALQAAAPRLGQAVQRGPFGAGGDAIGPAVHDIATATR